jgi:hypothetical protein
MRLFFGEMRYCANLGEIGLPATLLRAQGGLFTLRTALDTNEPVQKLIVSDCYNAGTIYLSCRWKLRRFVVYLGY